MFERQWFESESQLGMTAESRIFDRYLKLFKYKEAIVYGSQMKQKGSKEAKLYWERRTNMAIKILNHIKIGNNVRRVYMNGFWPGFRSENNIIIDLLKAALPHRKIVEANNIEEADIFIESCYGNNIGKYMRDTINILFLGENVRPRFSEYDISLTSDIYDYGEKNIYLPIWALEVDWFNRSEYECGKKLYTYRQLCQKKCVNYKNRIPEIVYIGNNNEPVRISTINKLEESGFKVNRYGSQSNPVNDKLKLIEKYKYTICMENSIMEGYVTEKPIHAYLSGCISIYRGSHTNSGLNINKSTGFLTLDQFNNDIELLIHQLKEYDQSPIQELSPLISKRHLESFKQELIESLSKKLAWI